jgi:hypothetical protein
MMLINARDLYRKSGGAQWRDLCVEALSWKDASRAAVENRQQPGKLATGSRFSLW